ncbi:hypothetical protein [Streptomyces drozdowiczii]|uniref:Transmembrane protein n=1 Tax=Streptomyces drozdowiczii TaxID=202862 RepID=A0ABY6PUA9_9ACTN|nr:hypothetical protein [Streptomyces drozdowiczii]MCX0244923.1 hypothetical protein [Streptomyces drozdowiczii]UZK55366.1 hypothetical protein NEH16_15650 [Streptomyces drozdowiczii]
MQMNSAPHLLTEDRPEYERLLDDALRHAHERPELAAVGERLNAAQLRTMALAAVALITATAAPEYEQYVKTRDEARAPARDTASGTAPDGLIQSGAGIGAVVTVLTPMLAGTAAAIFLLVGYLLKMLEPPPAFAGPMVDAGWFFAAVTAAAIFVAAIGLLIAALRNGSTSLSAREAREQLPDDVARAKDAWRQALLERGIVPFLRDALAEPAGPAVPAPHRPTGRLPKIGYSRPDFAGPDEGPAAAPRPTYSSPDFTSPDFGGPEHEPD